MRLPLPIWLVWHIARLTFIFLRWLAESSYGCISSNGWWKSSAFVLACLICAYLFVSAVRPDVSQNLRDEWRSLFAPRQRGISQVQIQPALTEAEINPDLDLNPTGTATQKEATSLATPNPSPAPPSPQPGATFLIPTLPALTTPTLPVPTLVLPTLSPMPAPRQTGPTFAIPTLPPIPPSPQPATTPPALPTLAFIPTLQPIPSPTPTPTQIPPTATPTPEPTATQIPSPTLTPVPPEPTLTPLQTRATKIDVRQLEALTHELINAQRSMHGIQPLDHIEKVRLIARYHSEDMASRNYFSHDNLEGVRSLRPRPKSRVRMSQGLRLLLHIRIGGKHSSRLAVWFVPNRKWQECTVRVVLAGGINPQRGRWVDEQPGPSTEYPRFIL